jgi:hypothetical protein
MNGLPRGAIVLVLALPLIGLLVIYALTPRGAPTGNRLVVLNTGSAALDSIVIEPEPPGANLLSARSAYLAAQDSVWIALPAATGDTDVRVWRGGRAVANHTVYFGGQSIFELRVGDSDQLGRYRRTG